MKKQLTLSSYRSFDLVFFTGLMVLFEFMAVRAVSWFHEVYYVSLFLALSLIVMMRWGAWSALTIMAGGITYCYASNARPEQYLVYVGGNLFLLLNLFWFFLGKARIREGYTTVGFVFTGYLLVEVGKSVVAAVVEGAFLPTLIVFLGSDALSAILSLVVILISRKQNGLFEDQLTYLRRINDEKKAEEAASEVRYEKNG